MGCKNLKRALTLWCSFNCLLLGVNGLDDSKYMCSYTKLCTVIQGSFLTTVSVCSKFSCTLKL